MHLSRLTKYRIAKYTINIATYLGLAIAGIFTNLPEGTPLFYLQPESLALNVNVVVPVVFSIFGIVAILKDQVMAYFKFPKGVGISLVLFAMGFLGWLISYWLMIVTGVYLILTIINTLYFNAVINQELEIRKAKLLEKAKQEVGDNNG